MKKSLITLALTFIFGAMISIAADPAPTAACPKNDKCDKAPATCCADKKDKACDKAAKCDKCEKCTKDGKCEKCENCAKAATACPKADKCDKGKSTATCAKADANCPKCAEKKAAAAACTKTCPVSGEKLGSMGEPYKYTYKQGGQPDQTVLFCCKSCVKTFEKNPAKYLASK